MGRRIRTRVGKPGFAVAYIRVSTDEQSNGVEAQQAAIAAWANARKVQIVAFVEDRGVSGATPVEDRPGLMQALFHIRAYNAGLLVAAKRERLARDVVVAATIERLAQDAGASIVTADGVSADDTPEGKLMRGLLDLFAQYERAVIRARTKAALDAKVRRGEYTGGRSAPYGFTLDANETSSQSKQSSARSHAPAYSALSTLASASAKSPPDSWKRVSPKNTSIHKPSPVSSPEAIAMTPDDRDRLRRLAQEAVRDALESQVIDRSYVWTIDYALDAIALWSLLGEPTCLLCGAQRKPDGYRCNFSGCLGHVGFDSGSVLCSRCRNYPTGGRE